MSDSNALRGSQHHVQASDILERLWECIGKRNWPELRDVLGTDIQVELLHSGVVLSGAEVFVRFNREYPGDWHILSARVHAISAELAVAEVKVSLDGRLLHAASFATVASGRVVGLREYWTESREFAP